VVLLIKLDSSNVLVNEISPARLDHSILMRNRFYIKRQKSDIRRFQVDEELQIDPQLDYNNIPNLSFEVKEKLAKFRPQTLVRKVYKYDVLSSDTCFRQAQVESKE
jgi:tRNA U34 5-carboxymethylaminomethyl modifying enzyme MnmG/GidA